MTSLKAFHAGTSYPLESTEALSFFRKALEDHGRPKKKAKASLNRDAPIVMAPHIDFRVDMKTYADAYGRLSQLPEWPHLFVILGVGHRCPHEFSTAPFDFETPLGRVESDTAFHEQIAKHAGFAIIRSPETYKGEHSLEFAIVWLQAIRDLYFPGKPFRVLPVLMGGLFPWILRGQAPGVRSEVRKFGAILAEAFRGQQAGTTGIIASIDGCHVGPRFDHDFAGIASTQSVVKKWEKELWAHCRTSSYDRFFGHLSGIGNLFYFDGVGVLSLLLQNFRLKAIRTSHKLWYERSDQSFVTFSGGHLEVE